MAYNKITSHFSSSETFSVDKYFSWNNSTDQAEFVDFIDFQDNTTNITASLNSLFITGNIDHKNNITASLFRLGLNSSIYFNDESYFIKNSNNNISISSPNFIELTGTLTGQKTLVDNGITGSLINVDSSGTKLLESVSGMTVTVENEEVSGLDRFVLNPANDSLNNTNVTYLHALVGNISKSLVCTGSNQVSYYQTNTNIFSSSEQNNDSSPDPVMIDLEKLTSEHKNYMKKGKFHIIYFNASKTNNLNSFDFDTALNAKSEIYLPANVFSIGSTLALISINFLPHYLYLPLGETFIDGTSGTINGYRIQAAGDVIDIQTRIPGVSYILKKITNTTWSMEDSGN